MEGGILPDGGYVEHCSRQVDRKKETYCSQIQADFIWCRNYQGLYVKIKLLQDEQVSFGENQPAALVGTSKSENIKRTVNLCDGLNKFGYVNSNFPRKKTRRGLKARQCLFIYTNLLSIPKIVSHGHNIHTVIFNNQECIICVTVFSD